MTSTIRAGLLAGAIVAMLGACEEGNAPVTCDATGDLCGQQLIAFESTRGIEVVRPDGSERTVLIHNVADPAQPLSLSYTDPAWSPDGTRLALSVLRQDGGGCSVNCWDVYTVSNAGLDSVNASNHPAVDDEATWSPDGGRIAFTSTRDGLGECTSVIHVMNADGSNVKRLTDVPGGNAAWSPDGSRIAFERRCNFFNEHSAELYVVNTDGTGAVNLTNNPDHDYQPAWSPDGLRLAFVSNRDNQRDAIWLMNADGSGARNLTPELVVDGKPIFMVEGNPVWSPDGTHILFVGLEGSCDETGCALQNADLFLMRADGTDVRRLTSTANESEWRPTWRASLP